MHPCEHGCVPPARLSRRHLLLGLGGAGLLSLGGCGIRLEDEAPRIPFVPARRPIPGEAALLAVLSSVRAEQSSVPPGASRQRADTLREALGEFGVPRADLEAAEQGPGPATPAEDVIAYESALAQCPDGLLPLVGSLTFARMLRPDPQRLWHQDVDGEWREREVAVAAAEATREAAWAMTVVVAKARPAQAQRARAHLSTLRGLQRRQESAGRDDGSTAPLGYDLDPEQRTAAAAGRLAKRTTTGLVEHYLALLPRLTADRDAARELLTWAVTAQSVATDWGADIPDLPGLQAQPAG